MNNRAKVRTVLEQGGTSGEQLRRAMAFVDRIGRTRGQATGETYAQTAERLKAEFERVRTRRY